MRLRLTLLTIVLACAGPLAHADDAAKLAKAKEYFKLAKTDQQMTQLMNQVIDQTKSGMLQQTAGTKVSPEEQQRANEFANKVAAVVFDSMSWDKLEPEFAKLYADAFTEQQLDDIVAFYKSPTGQAMVEKNPTLLKEGNAIAQQRMAEVGPKIQKLMQDYIAEEAKQSAQEKQKQ